MDAAAILQPVFVLGILTVVMFAWMVVTRVPAMSASGVTAHDARHTSDLRKLPSEVVQVADNYNHLFEQPTLFYAVAIAIAVLGHVDSFHVGCAWAFVVLRVLHSIVQATINVVPVRFGLFATAWLVLAIMIGREAMAVF